jgi:hypothetical protein
MFRWTSLFLSCACLACTGKGNAEIETTLGSSAGLVRVETGKPAPDNQAAINTTRTERDDILDVLKSSQPAAQACYADGVDRNPSLHGDLVARIDIVSDGSVGAVVVTRTTLHDDGVGSCVVAALQSLSFPAPSKEALVVSYPYVFVSDLTPPEIVRALYIKYGFIDPDDETSDDDKRKKQISGEDGWYEHW